MAILGIRGLKTLHGEVRDGNERIVQAITDGFNKLSAAMVANAPPVKEASAPAYPPVPPPTMPPGTPPAGSSVTSTYGLPGYASSYGMPTSGVPMVNTPQTPARVPQQMLLVKPFFFLSNPCFSWWKYVFLSFIKVQKSAHLPYEFVHCLGFLPETSMQWNLGWQCTSWLEVISRCSYWNVFFGGTHPTMTAIFWSVNWCIWFIPELPSGNLTVCYWTWPSRNSGFTH